MIVLAESHQLANDSIGWRTVQEGQTTTDHSGRIHADRCSQKYEPDTFDRSQLAKCIVICVTEIVMAGLLHNIYQHAYISSFQQKLMQY